MKNIAIVLMVFILGIVIGCITGINFQSHKVQPVCADSELIYEYVTVISDKYVTNFYADEWPFAHGFGLACLQVKWMLDGEKSPQEIEVTIERIRNATNLEKFMEEHDAD